MLRDDDDPVLAQEHTVSLGLVAYADDVSQLRAAAATTSVGGAEGAEGYNLLKVRHLASQYL